MKGFLFLLLVLFSGLLVFGSVIEYKVYPEVITPNDDGKNDILVFVYDTADAIEVSGKVFDILGRKVGSFKKLTNVPSPYKYGIYWDAEGVLSGIYVYQIEISGIINRIINGIVIVAK
ncbi:MAG: hypothetical protein DRI36_06240 [Caldiserica bacterium]|nr:MAG: hypothetical protein DRI36_06240 [Caldisericota bacterium]